MLPDRLVECPECRGVGLLTFETGPPTEPCTACHGTGRLYSDPSWQGVFAAMLAEGGVFLTREMRLLLTALDQLDRRLTSLEAELRSR